MYTLYKTAGKHGVREVVGYYDNVMDGTAAIEMDLEKFDEEARYELMKDGEDGDGTGIQQT